jgi:REP element-mobilizing transposase RayT
MKFDPQKHHRRSVRLKRYDYTQAGAYFITMVTYQRELLFGEIMDGEMRLSPMGQIAEEHWCAIPEHFPQVVLGTYVIMPNHVHGIIIIQPVGATQWVAPTTTANGPKRGSIGAIIGAYKMSVTRRIQKELNETAIWQRNYYEHVIRNDEDHNRIHLYIEANIDNWAMDDENPVKSK